jgi:uncharacterized membrane protein
MDDLQSSVAEPTQDERTMAILAHVLQVVGWWIAPLIIFLLKRDSRFASFHALQALLLQLLYLLFLGGFMVLWFAGFFLTIPHTQAGQNAPPPPAFFVLMPLMALSWMGAWGLMLVVAIVYGVKAGRGEWAAYPVLGRLARKILKISPDGTQIPAQN